MLGAGNQKSRGRRERDKDGGRAEERGGEKHPEMGGNRLGSWPDRWLFSLLVLLQVP